MIGGPETPGSVSDAETLSYLSQLICELKQLADAGGHRTLAAILGAALVEARIQTEEQEH